MTTRKLDKYSRNNANESSSLPPPIYKIEYPNCRTGVFSLRAPFTNSHNYEEQYTRSPVPNVAHPEYLHVDQISQSEQLSFRQSSQRDAQVQCSLISSNNYYDDIDVRRYRTFTRNSYNNDYLSPRYRVQLQLQPVQPNIYEVWDVETPPPRSIPISQPIKRREPSVRVRSPRLVDIQPLSDDESDDETDDVIYTYYPRKTYLPANVRMICVRQDANTTCY